VFKIQHVYLLLFFVPFINSAWSETKPGESFFSVQYENDLFTPNSEDRYYTSGLQLTSLKKTEPPAWLAEVSKWAPFYQSGHDLNLLQYNLGQKIYTPEDINATELQENDRPYAGYLYFGISVLSRFIHAEHYDVGNQFEITIGIVGPASYAEQTQKLVHEITGSTSPQGWDNQLNNELALGLNYSRFWRLTRPLTKNLSFGINPQVSGAFGNVYIYGAGGLMLKFGNDVKRDLSPPSIRPGFPGVIYFDGNKRSSWYIYLGFEGRLVLRDIFLDGNTFTDSHSVEKELLVGDMQYGFVYMFDTIRFSFSNMVGTDEFKAQKEKTRYGAINISFRY
jgi:hypothetical protein